MFAGLPCGLTDAIECTPLPARCLWPCSPLPGFATKGWSGLTVSQHIQRNGGIKCR